MPIKQQAISEGYIEEGGEHASLLSPGSGKAGAGESRLESLQRLLGLDHAIAFTIMARGWTSLAGVVTLLLIAHFLSGAEQGYYYMFGSLVAIQIVFELGFSLVILQMASHECAHLSFSPDGTVVGSAEAHGRLASVLQRAVRWYSVAALLLFFLLIPAGLYFFSAHEIAGLAVAWKLPWFSVVIAAALAFQIDPIFSFMEGCGYVSQVARTRFWQALLGSTLACAALLSRHGLFAPAMAIIGQVVVGAGWLWTRRRLLLGLLRHQTEVYRVHWRSEVWPFQWRIAVSWMCGYLIFQLFVPVLFAYWGPAQAGQMGMSLSVVNVLSSVAVAWVATKAAPFGKMIARKEYGMLDRTFYLAWLQSMLVSVGFSAIVMGTLLVLNIQHVRLASRMLPPLPFGILLVTMVLNHTVFCIAVYLRSHKQEKLLWQAVYGAIGTVLSTYFLGRRFGAIGIVSGYFVVCVVGLGIAIYIFQHYRRVWHAGT